MSHPDTPTAHAHNLHIDTTPTRRHGYTPQHQHYTTAPPSPSSPLSQPPFFPDMGSETPDDVSPAGTSVVTPTSSYGPSFAEELANKYNYKTSSEHSMLASFTQMPSPRGEDVHANKYHSFPLLPPHHPLRSKMYASGDQLAVSLEDSPPTTPKGHPLESGNRFMFKMHPITSPYSKSKQSYATTFTYLLRVPRRLRPLFLLGFSLFVFGVVYLNHAIHQGGTLDSLPQHHAAHMGRRVHNEELVDIGDRHRQAVLAQQAEAVIQASNLNPHSPKALEFASLEEEIAALIGFVTSTTANALPLLDPSVPLDPAIVLDFDPSRPSARENLDLLVEEIHTLFPIVLFGKMRDPWHREIKKMLAEYHILPAPLIIDVDQRRDQGVMVPLLERLLGTSELPQLLLKGKSLGSYHDVLDMRDKGTFTSTLEESGAVSVRPPKKIKKGIKERERTELERILMPKPIREG